MSSTSRGGKRNESDNYPSPAWVVHRLLERLELPGGHWLESSAGDGGIIKAVNVVRKDVSWTACELRDECRAALFAAGVEPEKIRTGISFLRLQPSEKNFYSVCINNVPFSIAQEMIEHTFKFAPHVIHLLRLNFLGTEKRNEFFHNNMPDVYVMPDRVGFVISVSCSRKKRDAGWCTYAEIFPLGTEPMRTCPMCGAATNISTSDSTEHAWFHWGPERGRRTGKIEVLNTTPVEQRR